MTPAGLNRLKLDENAPLADGGVSFLIDDKTGKRVSQLASGGRPTIGYGFNLAARGLPAAVAESWLESIVAQEEATLVAIMPWLASINPVWFDVLVNQTHNTGSPFHLMCASMQAGDAAGARAQLLDSRAARELPERYERLADAITAGAWGDAVSN